MSTDPRAEKERRAALLAIPTHRQQGDELGEKFLIVHVGAARYGIPIGCIALTLRIPELLSLPFVPRHIAGVICHLGEPLTLVDLASLLGSNDSVAHEPEQARALIIQVEFDRFALRVDQVGELVQFSAPGDFDTGDSWLKPDQVLGIAAGDCVLLAMERIARDPRIPLQLEPRGSQ